MICQKFRLKRDPIYRKFLTWIQVQKKRRIQPESTLSLQIRGHLRKQSVRLKESSLHPNSIKAICARLKSASFLIVRVSKYIPFSDACDTIA